MIVFIEIVWFEVCFSLSLSLAHTHLKTIIISSMLSVVWAFDCIFKKETQRQQQRRRRQRRIGIPCDLIFSRFTTLARLQLHHISKRIMIMIVIALLGGMPLLPVLSLFHGTRHVILVAVFASPF